MSLKWICQALFSFGPSNQVRPTSAGMAFRSSGRILYGQNIQVSNLSDEMHVEEATVNSNVNNIVNKQYLFGILLFNHRI